MSHLLALMNRIAMIISEAEVAVLYVIAAMLGYSWDSWHFYNESIKNRTQTNQDAKDSFLLISSSEINLIKEYFLFEMK